MWNGLNAKKNDTFAWDKMCQPKCKGGVNIKCCETWNIAAVCKQIWNISSMKDSLWVKWINNVYLKGEDFWSHSTKPDSAWHYRKLNKLEQKIQHYFDRGKRC